MRPASLRRGFTLVEQMVVGGLLSLVLVVSAMVLQPCLVDWRTVQDHSDMQRGAAMATQRLRQELRASSKSSLAVCTDPPAVAFLATRGEGAAYDPLSGLPVWDHFVVYFLDTQNRVLYRKQWPAEGGSAVPALPYTFPSTDHAKLTTVELALLCHTSNGTERPLASMVDSLRVADGATVTTVDLALSLPTRRGVDRMQKRIAAAMRVK